MPRVCARTVCVFECVCGCAQQQRALLYSFYSVCASHVSVCLFVYLSVPLCCGQSYGPHRNSSGESDECFSQQLPALFLAAPPPLSSSSSPPLPLHSWPRAPRPLVQLSLVLDLTMCRRLHSPHMVPSSTRDRWTHSHAAWHSGIGHFSPTARKKNKAALIISNSGDTIEDMYYI